MDKRLIVEFKKKFHLVEQAARDALSNHPLSLNFSAGSSGTEVSLDTPPDRDLGRLALLIRPFADPGSPLFFESVCNSLLSATPYEATDDERDRLAGFARSVRKGPIEFRLNDEVLDGPALYIVYTQGGYLEERPEHKAKLAEIGDSPMGPALPKFLFFSYCADVLQFCEVLYHELRRVEAQVDDRCLPAMQDCQGPCIYCRQTDGGFSTEEHVYPESLGNIDVILPRGTVCDRCNSGVLSDLDNEFVNHDFISFLRVVYLPINPKSGRFPKGRSQRFSFEKTGPRDIRLIMHGISKDQADKMFLETEDGQVSISLPLIGRRPVDPIMLGRCLYKIGLGSVAYHQGLDACLDLRYDKARDYVLGKRDGFPNFLIVTKQVTPSPEVKGTYQPLEKGTVFSISVFGVTFGFNLEEAPRLSPLREDVAGLFQVYPLYLEEDGE